MRGADRISNLPTEIIELVLTYLPIREAVRTSTLSKAWRYRWTSIPRLVFDQYCCPASCQDEVLNTKKLVSIINHVLLLHTGPIQVLKLADLHSVRDIGCWILRASRSSVRELVLANFEQFDELPSSLYTCNSLIRLELCFCILKLPSAFKGFKNLKTLDLRRVDMTDVEFESLISGCISLEKLTLILVDGLINMKINAPNLQCLVITCSLVDITFVDTHPKLSDISINLTSHHPNRHVDVKSFLTQFFIKLPGIQRLVLKGSFLEYLGMGCGSIPERLPTPCFGLRHLSIHINLSKLKEILVALCIFRSSPNLTELEIENTCDPVSPGPSNWLDRNDSCCALGKLRTLKLHKLLSFRESKDFIEFAVRNSPVLEKMYITGCHQDETVFFSKGSTQLELIFETNGSSSGDEIEI